MATTVTNHNNSPMCPYMTYFDSRFENHMITHSLFKKELFDCVNSIESLRCFQCTNFETYKLTDLRQHLKTGHTLPQSEEKRYECENCGFRTHSNYLNTRHKLLELCVINCNVKSEETQKMQSGSDLDYFQCDYCLFKTPSKTIFDDHGKKGHKRRKEKLHKCDHCPYTTKISTKLNNHVLMKHTDPDKIQWFECDQCPYKGKTKYHLNDHMKYHTNNVKLKCDQCPFETSLKKNLKRHILVKHNDQYKKLIKYVKCDHCQFETPFTSVLKRHVIAKHTDSDQISWFQCEHCSLKFKRNFHLQRHMVRKHDYKERLRCDQCPFETTFEKNLKRHVLVKHGDPVTSQKCDRCPFEAKSKKNLKIHVSLKHKGWYGMV